MIFAVLSSSNILLFVGSSSNNSFTIGNFFGSFVGNSTGTDLVLNSALSGVSAACCIGDDLDPILELVVLRQDSLNLLTVGRKEPI